MWAQNDFNRHKEWSEVTVHQNVDMSYYYFETGEISAIDTKIKKSEHEYDLDCIAMEV